MAYTLTVDIPSPAARVWREWASADALQRWLAPRARVDFRPGGAWEFFWAAEQDKDSTLGCKVLEVEPDRRLRFQWQGKTEFLPLFRPPGGPTVIEVRFEPTGHGTRITLQQAETREGAHWAAYEAWMSAAWAGALQALQARCGA